MNRQRFVHVFSIHSSRFRLHGEWTRDLPIFSLHRCIFNSVEQDETLANFFVSF